MRKLTQPKTFSSAVFGAFIGFAFKEKACLYSSFLNAFAAGVMLYASFISLILPSTEMTFGIADLIACVGIFAGAFCVILPEQLVFGNKDEIADQSLRRSAFLTVFAIALHNLPEGIAAGVGFGNGDDIGAFLIALGIALQNIPEGCIVIPPLIAGGVSPKKAMLFGALTGAIEIVGTFIGYFAVSLSNAILPFALAFAAGTMLYVISCEMIPSLFACKDRKSSLVFFLAGICLMIFISGMLA